MKVSMSLPNCYNWGEWGKRKKKAGKHGVAKATLLRNKKGYIAFLDVYTIGA